MQYFGAYRFIFSHPKWPILLLIGAVCQLVPIVGPLVLMGYAYEVIEAQHRYGRDPFPMFDFDRLGPYIMRGLWPFLVSLVAAIPLLLLTVPFVLAFVFSTIAAQQTGDPPALPFALLIVGIPVFLVLIFAYQFVMSPMLLRAGLSQDFSSAFSMSFVRDFLSRVWMELLLSMLFMIITAPFVMLLGFLLLIVGVYAAAVVMLFAHYHFQYHLYELYLARGGTPIPLKDTP